jgi:hypothetical protein
MYIYSMSNNGVFPYFTNPMCNDATYINRALSAVVDNYLLKSSTSASTAKVKVVRDGEKPYNDTGDVLRYKICAENGLVAEIEDPIQYLVTPGIADIDALRAIL